jgi:hypothetical protein
VSHYRTHLNKLTLSEVEWEKWPPSPSQQILNRPLEPTLQEHDLAWALADIADPQCRCTERHNIYVAIGVGDTFSAIRALVMVIVREGLPLPLDLVAALASWLDAHSHNESEPHLRGLVAMLKCRPPGDPSPPEPRRRYLSIAKKYRRAAPRVDIEPAFRGRVELRSVGRGHQGNRGA